jgi:hypothetical protein
VTDGTDGYNATHYRVSFFYDLAEASVIRMAFSVAEPPDLLVCQVLDRMEAGRGAPDLATRAPRTRGRL